VKLAIILFNLGGPDSPEAVEPFLRNLFSDPAIISLPTLLRLPLARFIARRRAPLARAIYDHLGGRSPILEETQAQARALEQAVSDPELEAKAFVAMRCWHPFSDGAAQAVKNFGADRIVLLPLYPQYSTTTTGSSIIDWRNAAARAGLAKKVTTLCCFHQDDGYVRATAALVRRALASARSETATPIRVLFSAHGLPETIVQRGDPYQYQIESTVNAVVAALDEPGLDWQVCYQSRATPQKWLDPSTEAVIEKAAHDKVAVLVVPIAFVSEHSETLVELDVEYRELAEKLGVPGYFRAPAQNSDAGFIAALADLVLAARDQGPGLCSFAGGRSCPAKHVDCPMRLAA
jgi:ferrochelatase